MHCGPFDLLEQLDKRKFYREQHDWLIILTVFCWESMPQCCLLVASSTNIMLQRLMVVGGKLRTAIHIIIGVSVLPVTTILTETEQRV